MKVFFDTSDFIKVLKKEENYGRVVEWLTKVRDGEHDGYTDTIAIAEIVYAFPSQGAIFNIPFQDQIPYRGN